MAAISQRSKIALAGTEKRDESWGPVSSHHMTSGVQIFIVVAAYNESKTIKSVIDRLLEKYSNVVVVDDGSTDDTLARLKSLPIFLLRHPINRGQGAALQTGIEFALRSGADIIVTFDADGQHDEEDIRFLLDPILRGECDLALGSRFLGQAHNIPLTRKFLLKAGVLFTRVISGIRVTDVHNGLRAFSRKAASSLHISIDRMGHASEILDQSKAASLHYKEVPVNIYYSPHSLSKGQSSWNALAITFQILIAKIVK
jgi:glycosyltransferase involved in cell wall biosynthesis